MPVINTNVNAIIARNSGAVNDRSMTKAMQSLSTGKRINVAADDAAGLAISTKMTSQIRGLDQAVRNANDGIALLQVVEGATVEMTNMLQRMRELAVQSANDTNTTAERSYLNDEFTQLQAEINRIAQTTQWNGKNVMDGSAGVGTANGGSSSTDTGGRSVSFQVGANASQTIDFDIVNFASTSASYTTTTATLGDATGTAMSDATVLRITDEDSETSIVNITDLTASNSGANTLQSELTTALHAIAGYENVSVTVTAGSDASTGMTINIVDTEGRDLSAAISIGSVDSAGAFTASGDFSAGSNTSVASEQSMTYSLFSAANLQATDYTTAVALNSAAIDTSANANIAIATLDASLNVLNEERASIGATINRLTYASDNLTNTSANVNAARSRILDTDYASATTELARTQIIQQASTAMLAQANQGAQSVLSLLK